MMAGPYLLGRSLWIARRSSSQLEHDAMDLRSLCRISLAVFVASGFGTVNASGQTTGKRIFATTASCELSSLLTREECRYAHGNALSELDEKSPRFASRPECEKNFKQCMIAGFGGKRVEFEPALRGFEVNVRSATDKSVMPVVDGDGSSLGFHTRTALRADTGISHALREQARARWAQTEKARIAAEAAAADARSPADDKDWSVEAPNSKALYATPAEPSPPTANDLAAQARRREDIRRAPSVY